MHWRYRFRSLHRHRHSRSWHERCSSWSTGDWHQHSRCISPGQVTCSVYPHSHWVYGSLVMCRAASATMLLCCLRVVRMRMMRMVGSTLQFCEDLLHVLMKMIGVRELRQVFVLLIGQDYESAEKPSINVGSNVPAVIVERPGANRLLSYVVCVGPSLPGTDLI